jgi:hypothetical protein
VCVKDNLEVIVRLLLNVVHFMNAMEPCHS